MRQISQDRAGLVGALLLVILGLLCVALGLFGVVRWLSGGPTSGVLFAVGLPPLLAAGLCLRRPSPTKYAVAAVVAGACGLFPLATAVAFPDLWPLVVGSAFWLAAILLIVAAVHSARAQRPAVSP